MIGKQTLAAMNVPGTSRIEQIIINMERYRWLKRALMGDRLVAVKTKLDPTNLFRLNANINPAG